jgi:hypothetical protein
MARKRYYDGGNYDGMDMRRAQERRDGDMITEDRSAIANLPQNVIMREYPRHNYMSFDLDDSIRGVDKLMNENMKSYKKGSSPAEKYETT